MTIDYRFLLLVAFMLLAIVGMNLPGVFSERPSTQGYTVEVNVNEKLGPYLTDSFGKTLYVRRIAGTDSGCAEECLESWTPFYTEKIVVPPALKASDFGTAEIENGKKQTTYLGSPLYLFRGDAREGDLFGQGLQGIWQAATPSGER